LSDVDFANGRVSENNEREKNKQQTNKKQNKTKFHIVETVPKSNRKIARKRQN
jgi:hypothetical protein